jgi:hypothetical protein
MAEVPEHRGLRLLSSQEGGVKRTIVILSWWFIAHWTWTSASVQTIQVGPFDNEEACTAIHDQMARHFFVTKCWHAQ